MNTPLTIATSLAQPFRTRRTSLALAIAALGAAAALQTPLARRPVTAPGWCEAV